MRVVCVFFLLFSFSLFAEKSLEIENYETEVGIEDLPTSARDPITWSPTPILPKVNIITGNYIDQESDFVVAGAEPLTIRRFYNHLASRNEQTGCWLYNPETYAFANFEYAAKDIFAAAGEFSGQVMSYEKIDTNGAFLFDPARKEYVGEGNGQTHPLNRQISYRKEGNPKDAFRWVGEIRDGSGTIRHFATPSHTWLKTVRVPRRKGSRKTKPLTPDQCTPYQLPITEEIKPNGNVIRYTYESTCLSDVKAYNSTGKEMGSLHLNYSGDGIEITGSDGRKATYSHTDGSLTTIQAPGKVSINYTYDKDGYLTEVQSPNGSTFLTEYDPESHKVIAQYGPVGPDGELSAIGRFVYDDDATTVFDAEDHKSIYHFDEKKRITTIERDFSLERFQWDGETGNLLFKEICDSSGNLCRKEEYTYDKNQNIIEEIVGNGKESTVIYRTYSDDGFNLKLSETDGFGKIARYNYKSGTNLLSSEFILDGETIKKRAFFNYDENGICIKKIIDDGINEDSEDLTAVTYRNITCIYPKQEQPCFGLPEVVEERTIDSQGEEILLHKVLYTYHPSGNVLRAEHYDAENNYSFSESYTYDEQERLVSKTNPLGHTTAYEYDDSNNLISVTGPRKESRKSWVYDQANRSVREECDGRVTQKIYDKSGRVAADIDECGHQTRYHYDSQGDLTQIVYPDGSKIEREYDVLGNLIKETDPNGYQTITTFDFRGQPLTICHPEGYEEQFSYYLDGTLHSHCDQNQATTLFSYDIFQNLIKSEIYAKEGNLIKTASATYSSFCLLSKTDGEGETLFYEVDFAGRKIAERQGEREIKYTYDSLGRVAKIRKGESIHVQEYDLLGQLIEKRVEDPSGKVSRKEGYAYDEAGNRTRVITSKGVTEIDYDDHGQVTSIRGPLGEITTIAHSYQDGYCQTLTDPTGIKTIKIHDGRGREVEKIVQNPKSETIKREVKTYDTSSNLIKIEEDVYIGTIYQQTLTNKWDYGPSGRVEKMMQGDPKKIQYTYDDRGRFRSTIKPDGTEIFHDYDGLGRLSRLSSNREDIDYSYTYDKNDRLLSVYDGISHQTNTRAYDAFGSVIAETLANKYTLQAEYDPFGRRRTLTLPDGTKIDYTYQGDDLYQVRRKYRTITYADRDLEGYPTKIDFLFHEIRINRDPYSRITTYDGPHYHSHEILYDDAQNFRLHTYTDPLGSVTKNYRYDDLDQLISEDEDHYSYDSAHNRCKKNDAEYQTNTLCQLVGYTYDANGNLLSDGEWNYAYDSLDRLVTSSKGKREIHYSYDSFDRRLFKRIIENRVLIEKLFYLWDGQTEIGAVVPGDGIVELRVLGEEALLMELGGKTYFPIHDPLGNLALLLEDKTFEVAESYRTTAFGEPQTTSQLAPWRFSGKRSDPETGLIYFGRRYYHPALGRWLTPDPAGFVDGNNLYAYVNNNPLSYCDSDGEFGFLASFVGAIIGAISTGFQTNWDLGAVLKGAAIGAASGFVGFGMGTLGHCLAGSEGAVAMIAGGVVAGASGGAVGGGLSAAAFGGDVWQGIGNGALYGSISGGTSAGLTALRIPDALANTTGGALSGFAAGGPAVGRQGALYSCAGSLLNHSLATNGVGRSGAAPAQKSSEFEEVHARNDTYLTTPNLKFTRHAGNSFLQDVWKYTRPILIALLGNGYSHVWHTKDQDFDSRSDFNNGYVPEGSHCKLIQRDVPYQGQSYAENHWANYNLFTNSCCSRHGYLHPAHYYSCYHYPDQGVYWWRKKR